MPTTKRRTARIAAPKTPSIGYIAIKVDYAHESTNEIHCFARKDLQIIGDNDASIEIKAGQEFYLVRAASLGHNMFYIVLISNVVTVERCTCPATQYWCKHSVAIDARLANRRKALQAERAAQPWTQQEIDDFCAIVDEASWDDLIPSWKQVKVVEEPTPAPKPTPAPSRVVTGPDWCVDFRGAQRRPAAPTQPLSTRGSLNGARAFSLMR